MIHFKAVKFFGLMLTLLAVTACEVTDVPKNTPCRLTVQLTDAPGNYEAVFVDIRSVRIKTADEDASRDWITVSDQPVRVDLLKLRNGKTLQIADEKLKPGTYSHIRLDLGSDNAVVKDGASHALETPSAQQSGLKLTIDTDMQEGETYELLVDFDASRSIVETGNGKFILKPVLRAVQLQETGSISGSVQPDSVQTSVMAIANGDTLSSLTQDGSFSIIGVPPQTYDLIFEPTGNTFTATAITGVSVDAGNDVVLDTITLNEQ